MVMAETDIAGMLQKARDKARIEAEARERVRKLLTTTPQLTPDALAMAAAERGRDEEPERQATPSGIPLAVEVAPADVLDVIKGIPGDRQRDAEKASKRAIADIAAELGVTPDRMRGHELKVLEHAWNWAAQIRRLRRISGMV